MLKALLPASVKRNIRLMQRQLADRKSGVRNQFSQPQNYPNEQLLQVIKTIDQPIFYNPLSANKVTNIRIAMNALTAYAIQPNSVFSFWEIIKKPTLKKGYQTGRNIIGDSLKEDIGGGLCQVSGMLYHLALETGMEIIERHNHTIDLYAEDKRYTPLGTDATVVYGYKDLRFKNPHNETLYMRFSVSQEEFTGSFMAENALDDYSIRLERAEEKGYRTVKTYRKSGNNAEEFLNLSRYIVNEPD